jgi:hypothetical protein
MVMWRWENTLENKFLDWTLEMLQAVMPANRYEAAGNWDSWANIL